MCRILVPWPGIKPATPELKAGVLTTGPPGKSQYHLSLCVLIYLPFLVNRFCSYILGSLSGGPHSGLRYWDPGAVYNEKWLQGIVFTPLDSALLTFHHLTKRFQTDHSNYPDMPGGSDSKESACNAGDLGSIPGLRRSPEGAHGNLFEYSGLEKRKRKQRSNCQHPLDHRKSKRVPEKDLFLLYWLRQSLWLCGSQ